MSTKRPTLTLRERAATARDKTSGRGAAGGKPAKGAPGAAVNRAPAKPQGAAASGPTASTGAPQVRSATPRPAYAVQPARQADWKPELATDSLAYALLGAANAVARVRADGMALPEAIAHVAAALQATPQARGAIQDIAYRSLRQLGRSEALVALMAPKEPEPPMLKALLCCALALAAPAGGEPPYEAFTVVDQSVAAAASHPDMVRAKGMVNAVLRRFLREQDALLAQVLADPVARWNYPQWWIDTARHAHPQAWQELLDAGNHQPPMTLRVNLRRIGVAAYLDMLHAQGMGARQVGPQAVRLDRPLAVALVPGFADGLVSVQDAGAQLAAPLLDLADGMHVLDACAAPGGKSGHILESAGVQLTALDVDPVRLARVGDNLARLGLQATLRHGDAQARDWWDGRQFDRILADVPCTASGIVRRHPDIRWLRRKSDTLQLATLSAKILDNLWQMLGPNGKFLFVTCSVWPQESEAQAAAFAVRNQAVRLSAPGQLLPASGNGEDHDGLFYALFQKHPA